MKIYHLGYISLIFLSCTVKAAVTLDGTVGQRLDLVGPDYQITQDLGQRTGHNLFHSFGEFSLSQGEIATFSGEHSIKNVIGRVTGGHPSHIDGTIRNTIPKADLYLINPAGMMFGKNVQLDVQGAFHASTADAIHFEDGEIFNALHPEQSSFSSANPSAFGFLTSQPQPLTLTGSQLAVPQQAHLSLIGGDIHIQADIASQQLATLQAQSGHIYIVSIADKGQVTLNPSENNRLSNGNILIQSAQLNTAANQAGQIYIRGGQFVLRNSLITASTGNDNGGAIDIQADDIEISYGSRLTTSSFGTGQGGDINLQATNDMQFFGTDGNGIGNQVFSNVNHTGQGGTVNLTANNITLQDGTVIGATTRAIGQGGQVNFQVEQNLTFTGNDKRNVPSGILTISSGSGDAGNISLNAGQIHLLNGTTISSDTGGRAANGEIVGGQGQGGHIYIVAEALKLSGQNTQGVASFITTNSLGNTPQAGDGGRIDVNDKTLHLEEGAQLATATFGQGDGGQINIQATEAIYLAGIDQQGAHSGLFTTAKNQGNAGLIIVDTDDLTITNEAQINANTEGNGLGGNIIIQANQATLNQQGKITAASTSQGDAGNIVLSLNGQLNIRDGFIQTKTNQADGGDIIITSPDYFYLRNGAVTTSVEAKDGDGGNIFLKPKFIVLDNSAIIARAISGDGGNIDITTKGIYRFEPKDNSPINASSQYGVDGIVTIHSPDENVQEGLLALPAEFVDVVNLLNTLCDLRGLTQVPTSFVIVPKEAYPQTPSDLQPSYLHYR